MKKIFIAAIVGLVFGLTLAANAEVVTVTDNGKHFADRNQLQDDIKRLEKQRDRIEKERERRERMEKERGDDPKPKFSGLG